MKLPRPKSITCPKCGKTSWHPKDILEGYCGNCHEFHDNMNAGQLITQMAAEIERSLPPLASGDATVFSVELLDERGRTIAHLPLQQPMRLLPGGTASFTFEVET